MPTMEIKTSGNVCRRCGRSYGQLSSNFPVSHASLYKGAGYLSYCNLCVEEMYSTYLRICGDQKKALRQLCRKLDLYWNDALYESVAPASTEHNIVTSYFRKINGKQYVGRSYDETLTEEGTLWDIGTVSSSAGDDDVAVSDEVRERFGPGYTDQAYVELNKRYDYWMSRLPKDVDQDDIGVQALVQQLVGVELDIIRLRANEQSTDKATSTFQSLLGKLMIDPSKKKEEDANTAMANTPLGVWLYRYEQKRPLPEPDDELKENRLLKYIFIWMGHVLKMLGIKKGYTDLYDKEAARLRVDRPDLADEDDESLIGDLYTDDIYSEPGEQSDTASTEESTA